MMLRYFMLFDYMDKVHARIAEIRKHETTLKSILVICFVGWSLTTWTGFIPSITVNPVQYTISDHVYKGWKHCCLSWCIYWMRHVLLWLIYHDVRKTPSFMSGMNIRKD